MTEPVTEYNLQCSCPIRFKIEERKRFDDLLHSGVPVLKAYHEILSAHYDIPLIGDEGEETPDPRFIRTCCARTLLADVSDMTAFRQDVIPEDLVFKTDNQPLPSYSSPLGPLDSVGEDDIGFDLTGKESVSKAPESRDPNVTIYGFLTKNGEDVYSEVGMGYKVRILDTNTVIVR